MPNTITVNPVTRISGFLEIRAEVDQGRLVNAMSSGLLFRGFEKMLQGRPPLDAIYFTQRICGICSSAHSMASALALESALGIQPDLNSMLVREFVHGCEFIQNHLRHFYQYTLPDYVKGPDINPLYAVSHHDFRLPQPLNDKLAEHYVQSLEYSRLAHEMLAILGGKAPHNHGIFVGGITSDIDISKLTALRSIIEKISHFVNEAMVSDAYTLGRYYPEYYSMGAGYGNLMSFGVFNYPQYKEIFYLGPSIWINGLKRLDSTIIDEDIKSAWYTAQSDINRPIDWNTEEEPFKQGAYSWVKAPRYQGMPMETGPLARMFISGEYTRGISTMDRTIARVLEAKKILQIMQGILQLIPEYKNKQTRYEMPNAAVGAGLIDTTRGALGHWINIEEQRIKNYSIITPSAWNLSPEDSRGVKGPVEAALLGIMIENSQNPIEIGRIVRSFDPCISCATHVYGRNIDSVELKLI